MGRVQVYSSTTVRGTELMGSDRFSLTEDQILTNDCYIYGMNIGARGCLDDLKYCQ